MAIKHHYTMLCDDFSQDASGKAVLFGTFVNVELNHLPAALGKFCLLIGFEGLSGDRFSAYMEGPDGEVLLPIAQGQVKRSRRSPLYKVIIVTIISKLQPMVFRKAGKYAVVLCQGKRVVHKRPFAVVLRNSSVTGGGR